MDLQSIFYIVAIIYMILSIFILLAILIIFWRIQKTAKELRENVINRVVSFVKNKNIEIIGAVAMGALAFISSRIKKIFKKES